MKAALNTRETGYTPTAKLLHWLVVLLLIMQYVVAWNMPHIGKNTVPDTIINLHFSLGVLILFVIVLRIFLEVAHARTDAARGCAAVASGDSHDRALCVVSSAARHAYSRLAECFVSRFEVSFFGLFTLPKLIPARASGFAWTGDIHIFISYYVLLPVAGLHIAAALYHEFIRHYGVLRRMLPASFS
jgi:cytochrome b561